MFVSVCFAVCVASTLYYDICVYTCAVEMAEEIFLLLKQESAPNKRQKRIWPFKQCAAIARVAYVLRASDDLPWQSSVVCIDWVKGNFDHAAECLITRPVAAPALSLHPDVYTQAENLISLGVPTSEILVQNQQLLEGLGGVCATSEYRVFLEHKVYGGKGKE